MLLNFRLLKAEELADTTCIDRNRVHKPVHEPSFPNPNPHPGGDLDTPMILITLLKGGMGRNGSVLKMGMSFDLWNRWDL